MCTSKVCSLTFIFLSFFYVGSIQADQGRMLGRVQVTPQGIEKLITYSLEKGLGKIVSTVEGRPLDNIKISPRAEDCGEEKLQKMSLAIAWKNCWGIPEVANSWYSTTSWKDFLFSQKLFSYHRPIPTSATLKAPKIRKLVLGESRVQCDQMGECQVDIPIKVLQVDTDLEVSRIDTQGKPLLQATGIALRVDDPDSGKEDYSGPRLIFKVKAGQDGRITSALTLDQAKIVLADSEIQLGYSLNGPINQETGKPFTYISFDAQDSDTPVGRFTSKTSEQNFINQAQWINYFLGIDLARNQIEDALEKSILPGVVFSLNESSKKFIEEKVESIKIATPNLRLQDLFDGAKIDKIYAKRILGKNFQDPHLLDPDLLLQQETLLHKMTTQLNQDKRVANYAMLEKTKKEINWNSNLLGGDIRDMIHSVRYSSRPVDVKYLLKIQDDLSSFCVQYLSLMDKFHTESTAVLQFATRIKIQHSKKKYLDLCSDLQRQLTESINSISQKNQKREAEAILQLGTVLEKLKPGKGLQVDLLKTDSCTDLHDIHDFAYENWDRDKNFDISAQISTDAINLTLKRMFESGYLNFCLNNKEFVTCGNGESDLKFEFTTPPQLKFDPFKGYYLYVDNIHSKIKVVGKWKTSDTQKIKIFIKPQAINGKMVIFPQIDIQNSTLFSDKDILSSLESVTKAAMSLGTYNLLSNWLVDMFVEGNLENIISHPIGIPMINIADGITTPGIYIEDINSSRGDHIKIYASILQEKKDPTDQLNR